METNCNFDRVTSPKTPWISQKLRYLRNDLNLVLRRPSILSVWLQSIVFNFLRDRTFCRMDGQRAVFLFSVARSLNCARNGSSYHEERGGGGERGGRGLKLVRQASMVQMGVRLVIRRSRVRSPPGSATFYHEIFSTAILYLLPIQ